MKKTFILFAIMLLCVGAMAQAVQLKFTGRDANGYNKKLDRVVIINKTKLWQETLQWPDTVITIRNGVGIEDFVDGKDFAFSQNYPNPFDGSTFVNLKVAEPGDVSIEVTDIAGRLVETRLIASLQPGTHQLRVSLATAGVYFLTARQAGRSTSMKMVCHRGRGLDEVAHIGAWDAQLKNAPKSEVTHPFNYGDQMEYVGYATFDGTEVESDHVIQPQYSSETIALRFDVVQDGINCPGVPTVTDHDGYVYQTVRIGKQCWMKSNLRTMHYADGTDIPFGGSSSSGTPVSSSTSPYYYNYQVPGFMTVADRGYLYNWTALMRGESSSNVNPSGVQGVCPIGWHVPSEAEWTQLSDYVKSRSEYLCGGNANNIAKALASKSSEWGSSSTTCDVGNNPMGNNATGFSVYPAGSYFYSEFDYGGDRSFIWSSSEGSNNYGKYFFMESNGGDVHIYAGGNHNGACAVRCLRDNYEVDELACPSAPTVTDYDGNVYSTVKIGQQCWMRQNLRTTHYANGTAISNGDLLPSGSANYNSTNPYYFDYTESGIPLMYRGYLYNQSAVMHGASTSSANPSGVQGICPNGWHVPSNAEWTQMDNYVKGQSQYLCGTDNTYRAKSYASTLYWNTSTNTCAVGNDLSANNATGFSVIPAGHAYRGYSADYYSAGNSIFFWTTTMGTTALRVVFRTLDCNQNYTFGSNETGLTGEDYLLSVRCVKN
jgi:uncharacterized protein (TIGR02145 family)